jgi:dGTP triphosphohydrolase
MNSDWLARREEWRQQPEDARDEAAVDYARIIHSASFRRLQGKTQVLTLGEGDFYRTRLTHSIEVAQIAVGIARQFQKDHAEHSAQPWIPDLTMIQAVGATHDLGHPPFSHGGEVALNYCMRENGGFEGNGQTLRIPVTVKRLLDIGVFSLLFPMIQTPEEAPAAVRACRYPPHGIRGVSLSQRANRYGGFTDYLAHGQLTDQPARRNRRPPLPPQRSLQRGPVRRASRSAQARN